MAMSTMALSSEVAEVLNIATKLGAVDRLLLARLLLDSLISDENKDETDWQNLSLTSFVKEWDNADDTIYDNWREIYGVPAR